MNIAPKLNVAPMERLMPATLPAATATLALFLLMNLLIATDTPSISDPPARIKPFVMDTPEPITTEADAKPVKPKVPERAPDWITQLAPMETTIGGANFNPPAVTDDPSRDIVNNSGGGIVAYLRVQPNYPSRALQRGIEGFVDLAFDITAAGATTNIRVINSDPEGVFERAAISALGKWKYKVPSVDGEANGQVDMMTRLTFSIEK